MIAILFAIHRGKESPHCCLAGERGVCSRKSQRLVIAVFLLL